MITFLPLITQNLFISENSSGGYTVSGKDVNNMFHFTLNEIGNLNNGITYSNIINYSNDWYPMIGTNDVSQKIYINSFNNLKAKNWILSIDHTQCGNSNLTNFTVLVQLNNISFRNVSNGGYSNDINGYDIEFFSDNLHTTKLNWEIENYDPVLGTLIAWVNIPTVYSNIDTNFYINVGSNNDNTFQGGVTGSAWNSNYKMVLHSINYDSTSNNNFIINQGATAVVGKIGNGIGLTGGGQNAPGGSYFETPSIYRLVSGSTQSSISLWVSAQSHETYPLIFSSGGPDPTQPRDGAQFIVNFPDAPQISWSADNNNGGPDYKIYNYTFHSNTPYNLVFEKTGNNTGILYINGVAITPTSGSFGNYQPGTYSFWGSFGSPAYSTLNGWLDEIEVSNVAFGPDWNITRYNNQNNPGNIGSDGFIKYSTNDTDLLTYYGSPTFSNGYVTLNGLNQYIDTGLTLKNTNLTLNFWANSSIATFSTTYGNRFFGYEDYNSGNDGIGVYMGFDNSYSLVMRNNGVASNVLWQSKVLKNRWIMYTMTIDSVNGTYVYINGIQTGSGIGKSYSIIPNATLHLGSDAFTHSNSYFNGKIGGFQYFTSPLSAYDIKNLYNTQINKFNDGYLADYISSNLVLNYNVGDINSYSEGNNWYDLTSRHNDSTIESLTQVTYANNSTKSYFIFSGTGSSFCETAYNSDFNLSVGDCSLEAYFKFNTIDFTTVQIILAKDTHGSNFDWCIGLSSSSIFLATQNTNQYFSASVPTFGTSSWYHIVYSKTGVTNSFYLNGINYGTNISIAVSNNDTFTFSIGCASYNAPNSFFKGYLSSVRIYNGYGLNDNDVFYNMNELNKQYGNYITPYYNGVISLTGSATFSNNIISIPLHSYGYIPYNSDIMPNGTKGCSLGVFFKLPASPQSVNMLISVGRYAGPGTYAGIGVIPGSNSINIDLAEIGASVTFIADTNWHFAMLTIPENSTIFKAKLYIDGVQKTIESYAGSTSTILNMNTLETRLGGIAGRNDSFANYEGELAYPIIYKGVMSANEILNIWNTLNNI
jgi:hypothetical protein